MDGAAAATGQKITGFCNNWYTLDTLWSFAVIISFLLNQLSILINRVSVSWLLVYSSRSVHFKILSLMGEPIKLSVDGFILVLTLSAFLLHHFGGVHLLLQIWRPVSFLHSLLSIFLDILRLKCLCLVNVHITLWILLHELNFHIFSFGLMIIWNLTFPPLSI